jgi:hypothetical protein
MVTMSSCETPLLTSLDWVFLRSKDLVVHDSVELDESPDVCWMLVKASYIGESTVYPK